MASGGAINLRMSLSGAEEVRSKLASLGPAGARMGRELDRAMREPGPGLKALNAGVGEVRSGVDALAARTGPLGAGLMQIGPWGLAAAAGLAAIAVAAAAALRGINDAARGAADLTDSADRIGVGVESLQRWNYVADESGMKTELLAGNLEKLNGIMGAFKLGIGDAKLKPIFEELGITQADLANVETADELMMMLADTLGQVQDRAQQVKLARGLGVEDSLPILRLGSERIRELSDEADRLGFVLDDKVVAQLDQTDRKLERAGQQMRVVRDTAVAPLAEMFGNAAEALGGWAAEFNNIESHAPRWISVLLALGRAMPGTGGLQRLGEFGIAAVMPNIPGSGSGAPLANFQRDRDPEAAALDALLDAAEAKERPGFDLNGHTSGGGNSAARQAAQEAKHREAERQRLAEQLADQLLAARRTALRADRDAAPEERARLARELLALDRQERDAKLARLESELKDKGGLDEAAQAQLAQLRDLNRQADAAAEAAVAAELLADQQAAREDAQRAIRAAEDQYQQVTAYILDLASSEARTADERLAVEMQLLEIAQRRMEADLRSALEAEKEPKARKQLVMALERLPQLFAAQAADVRRRTAGPVEAWREGQWTQGQATEFVQTEALGALDGLNRGLIDAFRNAESAGEAFDRMGDVAVNALQRVLDALLEIALQRMLIQPLANSLFGDGTAGSTGLLSGIFSGVTGAIFGGSSPTALGAAFMNRTPGRAAGGRIGSGGRYLVGEKGMELIDLPAGAMVRNDMQAERILIGHDRMMADQAHAVRAADFGALNLTVVNRGEPVKATLTRSGPGEAVLNLEPVRQLVRGAVREMGADGALAQSLNLSPRMRRR